jgi:hypothetical protein
MLEIVTVILAVVAAEAHHHEVELLKFVSGSVVPTFVHVFTPPSAALGTSPDAPLM